MTIRPNAVYANVWIDRYMSVLPLGFKTAGLAVLRIDYNPERPFTHFEIADDSCKYSGVCLLYVYSEHAKLLLGERP